MRSKSLEWPPKDKIAFPEKAKELLRKPAGKLLTGDPEDVSRKIKRMIELERPPLVIAVGDYTSEILRRHEVPINLYVIDGKIERRRIDLFKPEGMRIIKAVNEPGTLNPEAVAKLHELLKEKDLRKTVLIVDGEEDLLTLAAILSAPDRAIIVYGQPGEGSVVVKVEESVRKLALRIIEAARKR